MGGRLPGIIRHFVSIGSIVFNQDTGGKEHDTSDPLKLQCHHETKDNFEFSLVGPLALRLLETHAFEQFLLIQSEYQQ